MEDKSKNLKVWDVIKKRNGKERNKDRWRGEEERIK